MHVDFKGYASYHVAHVTLWMVAAEQVVLVCQSCEISQTLDSVGAHGTAHRREDGNIVYGDVGKEMA